MQVGRGIEDARWLVAPGEGMRPFLQMLAQAAADLGGRVLAEPLHGRFAFYLDAGGRRHPVHGAALGLNGDAAARLATDKDYAAKVLGSAGVPVPDHVIVLAGRDPGPCLAWAREEAGFPMWVKPNDGHGGEGVCKVADLNALLDALDPLRAAGGHVLFQAHQPGRELRVMVLEGRVVLGYERVGAGVGPANLSRGARVQNVKLHPEIDAMAVRATEALGLRWAGLDMIVPDPQGPEAVVLEVNAAPGLDAYAVAAPDNWARAREVLRAALEALGR